MMSLHSLIGISASGFTAAALVPQLIKLLKKKQAENISVIMMVVIFIGNLLWIYYGYLGEDMIIIISNAFSCVINILLFIFTMKYKTKTDNQTP